MGYIENNPTEKRFSKETGDVWIVRISPFIDGVEIQFTSSISVKPRIKILISDFSTRKVVYEKVQYYDYSKPITVKGLAANIDYYAEIVVCDEDLNEFARSNARLFRCGYFPGQVVDYIHPDDMNFIESGEFVGSPYIIKMENGSYIASHDVFCHDGSGHSSLCRFFVSNNHGKSWSFLSEIEHCTWGTMFLHKGALYMIGTYSVKQFDLVLYKSTDEARSWSEAIVLAKGSESTKFRFTPTAYAVLNNRIWFYVGIAENGTNKTATVSADLSADLCNPKAWTISDGTAYDEKWENAAPEWTEIMTEEGNVVVDPEGKLNILTRCNSQRFDTPSTEPDNIRAYVFVVDEQNPHKAPEFKEAMPFNGALHKFYIRYDEANKRYVALLNRMTSDRIWQRNVLSLAVSNDLKRWEIQRDLLNLEDLNWNEDAWEAGVQYPSFIIEENDIVAVVRTAISGADNFHNSNAMTFHRFKEIKDKFSF